MPPKRRCKAGQEAAGSKKAKPLAKPTFEWAAGSQEGFQERWYHAKAFVSKQAVCACLLEQSQVTKAITKVRDDGSVGTEFILEELVTMGRLCKYSGIFVFRGGIQVEYAEVERCCGSAGMLALSADMLSLLETHTDMHDVTFKCNGTAITANKSIVAGRSNYFRSMLFGGCSESGQSEIDLVDVNIEAFRLLADKYVLPDLQMLTRSQLKRALGIDTVLRPLNKKEDYGATAMDQPSVVTVTNPYLDENGLDSRLQDPVPRRNEANADGEGDPRHQMEMETAVSIKIVDGLLGIKIKARQSSPPGGYSIEFHDFSGRSDARLQAAGKLRAGMVLTEINGVDQQGLTYEQVKTSLGRRPCYMVFSRHPDLLGVFQAKFEGGDLDAEAQQKKHIADDFDPQYALGGDEAKSILDWERRAFQAAINRHKGKLEPIFINERGHPAVEPGWYELHPCAALITQGSPLSPGANVGSPNAVVI
eukprot:g1099.t1